MHFRLDDYIDGDVAYLIGLVMARGTITESQGVRQLKIEFPYTSLRAEGISASFDQETAIRLSLTDTRERLLDLLNTDISIVRRDGGVDFIIRFLRNSMIWRNILLITDKATSFPYFRIPQVFFDPDLPKDWKREFMRGYADVAGNIRPSNNYYGRHRVRLDVLNYPTNWEVPVQLCTLLQEQLGVSVQLINWGHPNMGRDFREHQVDIFAEEFLKIGFSFEHKQKILEELAEWNSKNLRNIDYAPCPGIRRMHGLKPHRLGENNADKLDSRLVGNHYDAYWQICKALGCKRMPSPDNQLTLEAALETIDDTVVDTSGDQEE